MYRREEFLSPLTLKPHSFANFLSESFFKILICSNYSPHCNQKVVNLSLKTVNVTFSIHYNKTQEITSINTLRTYVRMYVCIFCMYTCMYVCMLVCTHGRTYLPLYVCLCVTREVLSGKRALILSRDINILPEFADGLLAHRASSSGSPYPSYIDRSVKLTNDVNLVTKLRMHDFIKLPLLHCGA
jgi:hypothetical protein